MIIGGLRCDLIQDGTVFYPTDTSKTYPLLSFNHGWTEGGLSTDPNYSDLLQLLAAEGYVVVAQHSGAVAYCDDEEKHDQLRAIDFIKETPEFANRVDWNSKVGVYGHSMGGGTSTMNAADKSAIAKYNLGAAVAHHPVSHPVYAHIPIFFTTGTIDGICSPDGVKSMYQKARGPAVYAEMLLADHFECQNYEAGIPCPAGWTHYTKHWFNCHLKGMQEECDRAWNVCSGHPETEKPMAQCLTKNRETLV